MTVMFLTELCAATQAVPPTSAPACQGLWVTAGCVVVSSQRLSDLSFVIFGCLESLTLCAACINVNQSENLVALIKTFKK